MPLPRLATHLVGLPPERLPKKSIGLPSDFSPDPTEADKTKADPTLADPTQADALQAEATQAEALEAEATQADALQTEATQAEATQAEAWRVSRNGHDGLKVALAIGPNGARRDGTFPLTTAHRLQLLVALEECVGVPIDGPVRRELIDDDTLSARLESGGVAFVLDRTDGEVLFGAPMYHAWLALQELHRDDSPTTPGAALDAR
jgi:hypothetical protein